MATGVLLIGLNRATRLLGHLAGHDKSYQATMRLGVDTVTDDAEGEIISRRGAHGISEAAVLAAVSTFVGRIDQIPSAVSAIKVDGKRSYARVRAGEQVQLAARPVSVTRFDVMGMREVTLDDSEPTAVLDIDVVVDCSSGTYIRALARDLGEQLGTGGHLTALRRTRVGGFDLSQVVLDADGLELTGEAPPPPLPMGEVARRAFAVRELDPDQARDVGFGRALAIDLDPGLTALVVGPELLALYRPDGPGRAVAEAVFVG